ncbi:MAG TPA: transporter substrate-binding domain-containing protein [Xanthobacteraceae bacterium]|nr:transporter substrate-binding domain-containing protein [Xanthobacteraceae bacterium]
MPMLCRSTLLLMAAAAILAGASPAHAQNTLEAVRQKGVLVAGSSAEYPPFEYVADGKLVGYDVDMADEITRRMGAKVAWEKIDFKGIVAALTAKRVDVLITALTWTPERAERIAFSDPYFDAGIGAITPQSSTIAKVEDLTGRRVGVQLGSSGERYVRETIGSKVGQLLTYDSITLAINDLKNGRVDAVVNPLPVLRYAVRNDAGFRYTAVWDTRVVGINTRLDDKELLAEINRHLRDLKSEGFLAKLETKWFGPGQ